MYTEGRGPRLHLIGGFELHIGGDEVLLQPAMQRLLAFVAMAPRGVERLFAALQLWPDHSEERAKANLRSTLWRLRRLPARLIDGSKTRLRLAPGVWVDTRDGVGELTAAADGAAPLPFGCLMTDLLPDWYDDWLIVERERLRQLHLDALERRARAALATGGTSNAIQLALSALAVDPIRETANRVLIEAQLAEGNQCDARRTLAAYCERVARDPGLVPSPELAQLVAFHTGGDHGSHPLVTQIPG